MGSRGEDAMLLGSSLPADRWLSDEEGGGGGGEGERLLTSSSLGFIRLLLSWTVKSPIWFLRS